MSLKQRRTPRQQLWRLWLITVHLTAAASLAYPLMWKYAETNPFGTIEITRDAFRWDPHDTPRGAGRTLDHHLKPDLERVFAFEAARKMTIRP